MAGRASCWAGQELKVQAFKATTNRLALEVHEERSVEESQEAGVRPKLSVERHHLLPDQKSLLDQPPPPVPPKEAVRARASGVIASQGIAHRGAEMRRSQMTRRIPRGMDEQGRQGGKEDSG